MCEMPLPMLENFMKKMGAERVEKEALELMARYLDKQAELIAKKAISVAKKVGRNVVTVRDMETSVSGLERK